MGLVGTRLAVTALLVLGANTCPGSVWSDPAGDQLDVMTVPSLDLVGISTCFEPGALIIELSFDPLTTTPGDLLQFSGYLDLDTDSDPVTGRGLSHIEEFAPDSPQPPVMGVDYYVEIFSGENTAFLWEVTPEFEQYVASCPIEFNGAILKVSVPRCGSAPCDGIAVGARFGFSVLVGNYNGVTTDRAPNDATPYIAIPTHGDFDEDGDVDGSDLGHFKACCSGPAIIQTDPDCQTADLDDDDDVDQDDFGLLQRRITGPF